MFYVVPVATCDGQAVLQAPAPPRVSVPVGLCCPVLGVRGQSLGVSELRTVAHLREVLPGRAGVAGPTQPWATCTHWAPSVPRPTSPRRSTRSWEVDLVLEVFRVRAMELQRQT